MENETYKITETDMEVLRNANNVLCRLAVFTNPPDLEFDYSDEILEILPVMGKNLQAVTIYFSQNGPL